MFGRMMSERLGKIHFWGTIIAFNFIFIPLFVTGAAGDQRRVYNHLGFPDLATPWRQDLRIVATMALVAMLAFQPIFIFNFIRSMFKGALAGANPWRANTLEWLAPSPPPHGNFAELPVVYRGPYEYSVEDREEDFWPQHIPAGAPTAETSAHVHWQA
jgi:cytochrome c oxidase subunit 1